MKIRTGFVSNSSSSNFIVAFPRVPKSAKEVQKILFGNELLFDGAYDEGRTNTEEIAKTVWGDIKPQKRWSEKFRNVNISNAVAGGWSDGVNIENFKIIPDCITKAEYNGETIITAKPREQVDWDKYNEACEKEQKKVVDNLLEHWEGKTIYVFTYGDEGGAYESILEHGGIFDSLPHRQISCH